MKRSRSYSGTLQLTASKPAFRQLEIKLNKVAALYVATDELLEDAAALSAWLQKTVPLELKFKVEDAIINGDGVLNLGNLDVYVGF